MKKKKLISFDLDQTLVDTLEAHTFAFYLAFKKQGIKINKQNIKKYIDGRHSKEVILSIKPKLKKRIVSKIRKSYHKFLYETVKYAKPIPLVNKILKKLKKNYKIALVTNCEKKEAELFFKAGKIDKKIFDVIVLANQVKRPKPYPEEILKAERIAHVKPYVHIGDSIYDVIASKRAHVISVVVLTGQTTKKKLKEYKPNFIIKSIYELPKLLKSLEKN